jgi:hypothetical protein
MKAFCLASGAVVLAALAGCAIVPYPEPAVVYAAPPPPPAVVVHRPHRHYWQRRRWHHYHGH